MQRYDVVVAVSLDLDLSTCVVCLYASTSIKIQARGFCTISVVCSPPNMDLESIILAAPLELLLLLSLMWSACLALVFIWWFCTSHSTPSNPQPNSGPLILCERQPMIINSVEADNHNEDGITSGDKPQHICVTPNRRLLKAVRTIAKLRQANRHLVRMQRRVLQKKHLVKADITTQSPSGELLPLLLIIRSISIARLQVNLNAFLRHIVKMLTYLHIFIFAGDIWSCLQNGLYY